MKTKIAELIPPDKALHFILGIVIFAIVNPINPFLAVVVATTIGFIVEIKDKADGKVFSFSDWAATILGGLTGLFIALI